MTYLIYRLQSLPYDLSQRVVCCDYFRLDGRMGYGGLPLLLRREREEGIRSHNGQIAACGGFEAGAVAGNVGISVEAKLPR